MPSLSSRRSQLGGGGGGGADELLGTSTLGWVTRFFAPKVLPRWLRGAPSTSTHASPFSLMASTFCDHMRMSKSPAAKVL